MSYDEGSSLGMRAWFVKKSDCIVKALTKQHESLLLWLLIGVYSPNPFLPLPSPFLRENQMFVSLFSLQKSMSWTHSKLESPGHVCILPRLSSQERNALCSSSFRAHFKMKVHTSENWLGSDAK